MFSSFECLCPFCHISLSLLIKIFIEHQQSMSGVLRIVLRWACSSSKLRYHLCLVRSKRKLHRKLREFAAIFAMILCFCCLGPILLGNENCAPIGSAVQSMWNEQDIEPSPPYPRDLLYHSACEQGIRQILVPRISGKPCTKEYISLSQKLPKQFSRERKYYMLRDNSHSKTSHRQECGTKSTCVLMQKS